MRTVKQIVEEWVSTLDPDRPTSSNVVDPLIAALVDREDEIASGLRSAGDQLGADGAFVNKAIADLGLGTPYSPEEMATINRMFTERVDYWNNIIRQQRGEGDPS